MVDEAMVKNLKKYRHLIACLIDESYGYFSPVSAYRAIEAHKSGNACFCELYCDIAGKRGKGWTDEALKEVNRDYLGWAIRRRKNRASHEAHLRIVDRTIATATQPFCGFASYF